MLSGKKKVPKNLIVARDVVGKVLYLHSQTTKNQHVGTQRVKLAGRPLKN